ncbi:transaminase [Dendrothele bispora CBS 962.96]|uniref:Transaminase n=1 Tax=Dendrothele bispora (strain CBS 962.96) TaxID=1314807 RepID=A0A4S8MLM4_DENBC|nr:transaminase [Dendrothele bispora CBS 962.96]
MQPLTPASLNPAILNVEYAVRGELAIKAEEYRNQLKNPDHELPFDRVISSNIGNPQQKGLDQPPITFVRQIAALMEYPALATLAPTAFPSDVLARAAELQSEIGSIGAYSHSQGVPYIRHSVAKFIAERDGFTGHYAEYSDPNAIFLTAGASAGVSLLLSMLIASKNDGILIPIPQYPLYTAAIAQFEGKPIPYYLSSSTSAGWQTSVPDIREAIAKAKKEGTNPKALVVINPGNPTGSVLDRSTMDDLVKVCEEHSLVLLADEVYQDNLHARVDDPSVSFTSLKKVTHALQSPIPLISFHSTSKGVLGECGRRGGYFECTNISPEVRALIYKMVSVGLCPPLQGQIAVDTLVRPPKQGEPSYALWKEETGTIHKALASRTSTMTTRLNALPGVKCYPSPGALYLFPEITLSEKAVKAAKEKGKAADALYALELLDETGICVVPGSGFGQKEGVWHYRLTCLCPGVDEYVGKLEKFHKGWVEKYGV